ncbi:MAG: uroporphyrinogen decarboxylase [bacterium]|nr:uroporphyrinogen decarboxylase [bacterium]
MAPDTFLKACRREPTPYTPIWIMRQAGRYLAEYRAIRQKTPFLTMCKTPELAAEVTLQPLRRFALDAAIIFADILLPLEPMGADLEFTAGEGPVIHTPVRTAADVERLRLVEPEADLPFVLEAIRLVRAELEGKTPLIGFSGAPFTLASYLIEGGASRHYVETKRLMYGAPEAWDALMAKLATVTAAYLNAQIAAGVQVVQLFDSWIGCLSPADYARSVLPHSKAVISSLTPGIPVIHFGTGTATLLELMREAGGDVIGLDWRVSLGEAWERLGPTDVAVQGNLDPVALHAPESTLRDQVEAILKAAAGRPGHIFNLGHGVLPTTSVDAVSALVDMVHELSKR